VVVNYGTCGSFLLIFTFVLVFTSTFAPVFTSTYLYLRSMYG
jgi:hypothetical protein